MHKIRAVVGCALLSILMGGCANPVTDALIEQPLGALSELGINLQFQMERDPLVHGYVNQLGQEQRQLVRRKNVPYRFSVVELEEPNAFAIPYGGIYVTKGLLRFADGEDELAFIIGHEIGHVERRHSSLAFQRNLLISLGLALVTNDKNKNWMEFASLGNYFLDLHFSRQNETSADTEGVMYAVNSGHDPAAGEDFFHRLDARYGATPRFFSYFQTHPINRDRINHMHRSPFMAEDPLPLNRIASGAVKRGLYRTAETHYQRAVKADPNQPEAYVGLARLAAWRGDVKLARQLYLDAVAHGADPQVMQAESAALPATPPAEPNPLPAGSAEVRVVRASLEQLTATMTSVAEAGQEQWREPLSASPSLVNGYNAAGSQLDRLYGLKDELPKLLQDIVVQGQKLRAGAMRAASEVGAAQEQAELALKMIEDNRDRAIARLADQPSAGALSVARAVLVDGERAAKEIRDGTQRLGEVTPSVRDAVKRSYQAIDTMQLTFLDRTGRINRAHGVVRDIEQTQRQLDDAVNSARRSRQAVYTARVRALQSSIDITLADKRSWQRAAARKILARYLLTEEQQLDQALASGLTYGEAAYVLGMSRSAEQPTDQLLKLVQDAGPRQTVDRLDPRAVASTANVAILLKLADRTLRQELEPAGA